MRLILQMVGHPKHVAKALDVGMDIICAQVNTPLSAIQHERQVNLTRVPWLKRGQDLAWSFAESADGQGGEGGGHTRTTTTSILNPACVDACKGRTSPLTGGPVSVSYLSRYSHFFSCA